jgi:hypothetical protein
MIIRGMRGITLWKEVAALGERLTEIFEDIDMPPTTYRICYNCKAMPYDHMWVNLNGKKGVQAHIMKCKKGIETHDLNIKAEKCKHFKLKD